MPLNTVKVDRTTRWGNPFYVSPLNRQAGYFACTSAAEAVAEFRGHLRDIEDAGFLLTNPKRGWEISMADIRRELRGKNLACWCGPGQQCHADVLLEFANRP